MTHGWMFNSLGWDWMGHEHFGGFLMLLLGCVIIVTIVVLVSALLLRRHHGTPERTMAHE